MIRASEIHDHNGALRAHTDWRRFLVNRFDSTADSWLGDRYGRYGREATAPSYIAFRHMREDTVSADTCWMAHDMMDLCQHAMETFDPAEPFTVDDAFIPHGFMVLPEAWRSRDINDRIIAHRAYLWRMEPHGVVILPDSGEGFLQYTFDLNYADQGTVEPALRITTISHVDDEDDFTSEWVEGLAAMGIAWGIAHATTIPLRLVGSRDDTKGEGDSKASWLTFWRVAQKLMSERIVTSDRRQAARAVRRDAQRGGYDTHAPRVIELRRPSGRDGDPEGERVTDVAWSHRWVVRGHWRQQPYPSEGVTRQKWIGSYVKGPDNLPLVVRERVWNWDR